MDGTAPHPATAERLDPLAAIRKLDDRETIPVPPATADELRQACAWARDEGFAQLVTLVIGLAADRYPEELRHAIGRVFDLEVVEEQGRHLMASLQAASEEATEARRLARSLRHEVSRLQKEVDTLRFSLEKR